MKITDSKASIAALSFLVGAGMMFAAQKMCKPKQDLKTSMSAESKALGDQSHLSSFDSFLNDDFFGNTQNPIEEMRRMEERMKNQFAALTPENHLLGADIHTREDARYVYYDIAVRDLKKEKVKVKVENGMISITGVIENKSEQGDDSASFFSSVFHRSFPVPEGVDAAKMEVEPGKDQWVVKLPKIDTQNV